MKFKVLYSFKKEIDKSRADYYLTLHSFKEEFSTYCKNSINERFRFPISFSLGNLTPFINYNYIHYNSTYNKFLIKGKNLITNFEGDIPLLLFNADIIQRFLVDSEIYNNLSLSLKEKLNKLLNLHQIFIENVKDLIRLYFLELNKEETKNNALTFPVKTYLDIGFRCKFFRNEYLVTKIFMDNNDEKGMIFLHTKRNIPFVILDELNYKELNVNYELQDIYIDSLSSLSDKLVNNYLKTYVRR